MRVAIVDVLGSPYDGSTLGKRGLGGSESAVISIARELVKLGIRVDVFNDCESLDCNDGEYDGVEYNPLSSCTFTSVAYDVMISSRSVQPFLPDSQNRVKAAKNILWLHDTFVDGDEILEQLVTAGMIDEIWTLSDFHTQYISTCNHGVRRMGEVLKRKIWQTRNGVNLYDAGDHLKNPNQFVWNASVTKGLKTLLEDVWPGVRRINPAAQLVVIGGYYNLVELDEQYKSWQDMMSVHHNKNGVNFVGLVSQQLVAEYLSTSSFMIYPQSQPETFGISTLEAQAYGVPVITGRFGALEEVAIEDACYLMDYPVDSNQLYTFNKQAHVGAFLQLVERAYNNPYLWNQKSNAALKVRDVCTWDNVALQWKQHLYKITDRYLAIDEYRKVTKINQRCKEIFNTKWSNEEDHVVQHTKERKLVIIVPFRNALEYIGKCIVSIAAQDYDNYQVYLIDDESDDGSYVRADMFLRALPKHVSQHFVLSKNKIRVGALANQCNTLACLDNQDVAVLIDGDDWLVNDPNIFKKINRLYNDGAEMTYGSCHSVVDNIQLIAQEYPPSVKKNKSYREHKFAWNIPYTHIRTFKVELYRNCARDTLRDSNGDYYMAGGDGALFYALIEAAEPDNIVPVRDVWYHYNDANPLNDYKVNSEEQTKNANAIMSNTDKKKILIAIPTAQNIHPETFKSIYNLEVPDGYETEFQYFFGYCIDQVRNLIASWVVNGYDYLFSVDYDMSFPPDTLKRLLAHDVGIVSGLYRQRKPQLIYEAYKKYTTNGSHVNIKEHDISFPLTDVSAVGMGCCLIKKRVFEDIGYPYYEYHHALDHNNTKSEDVDFCEKARKHGMWFAKLDPTVRCTHHGHTTFELPPLRTLDPTN